MAGNTDRDCERLDDPRPPTPGGDGATDDERVAQRVWTALDLMGFQASHMIRVDAGAGTVRLTGCVSSFYVKQCAQEAARHVTGVERVENLLEVTPAPSTCCGSTHARLGTSGRNGEEIVRGRSDD